MTVLHAALLLLSGSSLVTLAASTCLASSSTEVTINKLFSQGGAGTVVQLCASTTYTLNGTIQFSAVNQELSTAGYPTGTTRAIIQLGAGNGVSTLVDGGRYNGVKLRNVVVDGRRPSLGLIASGGGANIEFGGATNGQVISYVASKNPRAWSCMHVIESGDTNNPCINATITSNDIGPCGQSGQDANKNNQWADGISFACTNSVVSNNVVTGPTDAGIVLFGAPGTTVSNNTVVSSSTYAGFGGINLVDGTYNGNYSGVVVTGNKITGTYFFAVGIAIGASVWGDQSSSVWKGPAKITNNTIAGNVTFPVAVNGWSNGLTVTGNTVSGVAKPSKFSELGSCSWPTQQLWQQGAALSYYSPGVTGAATLQTNFVNSTAGSPTYFLCTQPLLPASTNWTAGGLSSSGSDLAKVHGGILLTYQGGDGNLVIYNTTLTSPTSGWAALWSSGGAPGGNCTGLCSLNFQSDGNLVAYFNGTPYWTTGSNPNGRTLVLGNVAPYLSVRNATGKAIWTSS